MPRISGLCALGLVLSGPLGPLPAGGASEDPAAPHEQYALFCAPCHGATGGGREQGPELRPPPRDFSRGDFKFDADGDGRPGQDADLRLVIARGAEAYGGSPLMTAFGGTLSEAEIAALAALIRSLAE